MVEQHSAMRFAWLRNKDGIEEAPPMSPAGRLVLVAYNVMWWVPIVLTFAGVVSYRAGLVSFLAITGFRAGVNVYRNNVLPVAAAQRLPLRSP